MSRYVAAQKDPPLRRVTSTPNKQPRDLTNVEGRLLEIGKVPDDELPQACLRRSCKAAPGGIKICSESLKTAVAAKSLLRGRVEEAWPRYSCSRWGIVRFFEEYSKFRATVFSELLPEK